MRILVTGGAGFVGHHLVEHFVKNTDFEILVFDKLNYSGHLDRLRDISCFNTERVQTLTVDFSQPLSDGVVREIGEVDYIFHLGAESHVDRSIDDPTPFVVSNVLGTQYMLDFARGLSNLRCFYYFGTDEVFGPAPDGIEYEEDDTHNPTNPYSATKSGGEMLVKAYRNTYGLPAVITRSMNIFGERQHPEKYIPLVIQKTLQGDKVLIHADPTKTRPGSRYWIHARNVADGYLFLVRNEIHSGDYHITGCQEVDNQNMAKMIAEAMDRELNYELIDFHSSRPGHDLRYALSGKRMAKLGWTPPVDLKESLQRSVRWTLENDRWLSV